MIKYNVGDLIECGSGIYVIVEAQTEHPLPAAHKYKVLSLSGEVKQVELCEKCYRLDLRVPSPQTNRAHKDFSEGYNNDKI